MNNRVKYPRTFHLTFSPGITNDDKVIDDPNCFNNKEIVVTEKLDGECTTFYSDYIHARSIDGRHHSSRDWVKQFHGQIKHEILNGDRICGENMYAQHSIPYTDLESYFYGFSYWCGELCLDYDNTLMIFNSLGIITPTLFYRGIYDEETLKELADILDTNKVEGFVVRTAESFHIKDFSINVAKWVRKGHVQTEEHWLLKPVIPNKLRGI